MPGDGSLASTATQLQNQPELTVYCVDKVYLKVENRNTAVRHYSQCGNSIFEEFVQKIEELIQAETEINSSG